MHGNCVGNVEPTPHAYPASHVVQWSDAPTENDPGGQIMAVAFEEPAGHAYPAVITPSHNYHHRYRLHQPTTNNQQPTTGNRQPTTDNQRPTTNNAPWHGSTLSLTEPAGQPYPPAHPRHSVAPAALHRPPGHSTAVLFGEPVGHSKPAVTHQSQ